MPRLAKAVTDVATNKRIWLQHKEAWPIMGAIGAALTWLGYNSVVSLTMNPDVHWDREQRGSMVKSNEAQAENWYNRVTGRYRSYDNDVGNVGVFEKLNAKMGGKNMTTRKDDPDRLHD